MLFVGNGIMKVSARGQLIFVSFCWVLVAGLGDLLVTTDHFYEEALRSQLPLDRIEKVIKLREYWKGPIYMMTALVAIARAATVAFLLFVGSIMSGVSMSYRNMFMASVRAELVNLIEPVSKIIWFGLIKSNYSPDDVQGAVPMSLLNFVDSGTIPAWEKYLLGAINLIQGLYIYVLAVQVSRVALIKLSAAIRIVLLDYGLAWVLWIAFVDFLVASYS
jgi:hypothetical protein